MKIISSADYRFIPMMTRKFDKYNDGFFDATLHFYNKLKELKGE